MDADQMTALQKHVAFFDINKDGVIWPWETFTGFRMLGFPLKKSIGASMHIHRQLSSFTLPPGNKGWFWPIYVENVAGAIHGSDSGSYNKDGSINEEVFNGIWPKYEATGGMTASDIKTFVQSNRDADADTDPVGPVAACLEWSIAYAVWAEQKKGEKVLAKESSKDILTGDAFYSRAAELRGCPMKKTK